MKGLLTVTAVVVRGDARALPLPDASVDLIVTSPPYWALRSYTDGGTHYDGQIGSEATPAAYIAALLDCTREWVRVLKPTGSIMVNLGDKYSGGNRSYYDADLKNPGRNGIRTPTPSIPEKSLVGLPWRYAIGCIDQLGLILRAEIIWSKPNGLPESVSDRVRRSHEQWFHLTRLPRYFAAVDEIREPQNGNTHARRGDAGLPPKNATGLATGVRNGYFGDTTFNPLGKLPSSVWTIPSEPLTVPDHLGVDHFAAFPTEWPKRLIVGWSPRPSVILDPFGGTGTVALVASALGRIGISIDRSADYSRLARWRIRDPAQRAKVLDMPKPPVQIDGQGDLLAELLNGPSMKGPQP
jgi:DNA modification methylase